MLGTVQIYNFATGKVETYEINGGQVRRGKRKNIVIAGNVPFDQHTEVCHAINELERVLLKAQGWDGKMNLIHDRD